MLDILAGSSDPPLTSHSSSSSSTLRALKLFTLDSQSSCQCQPSAGNTRRLQRCPLFPTPRPPYRRLSPSRPLRPTYSGIKKRRYDKTEISWWERGVGWQFRGYKAPRPTPAAHRVHGRRAAGTMPACLRVTYADGSEAAVDLKIGSNVIGKVRLPCVKQC